MIRNWAFPHEDRTPETAERFGSMFHELEKDRSMVREVRGTLFLTFPDEEFPGDESPLLDRGVQAFLQDLFNHAPQLMYYLSDVRAAASLLLCAAAFCPDALTRGNGGDIGVVITPEYLATLSQLLLNAAVLATQVGQSPKLVLTHLNDFPSEVREAVRDAILQSIVGKG